MRSWVDKYVGLRFKDGGRTFEGVDCWGLVRLVYQEELRIELPTYGEISAADLARVAEAVTDNHDIDPWVAVEVKDARPFDVVVMRFYGQKRIGHVGLVTGDGRTLLHTERRLDAALVPLGHLTIKHRIVGLRRHKSTLGQ